MNFKKLKQLIADLEAYSMFSESDDSFFIKEVMRFFVEESKDPNVILNMVLQFQQLKDEQNKEKQQILYFGLESAFMGMMEYVDNIEKFKTAPKKLKDITDFYFNNDEGNIAFIINIAKAYFPLGHVNYHSQYGIMFFNKFREFLLKNKDKYLTGKSKEWAEQFNHIDYIKLVVEEYEKENKLLGEMK